MFQIRLVIALILTVAFLPGKLAAQYSQGDSGEYIILNAQYGTARRHVDVTSRLKEAARRDRTFRMGNSTFGVDPDPGQVKTLRIFARGRDGRERMFEYREGSTVDGAQFRGWSGGDWGDSGWNGGWEGGAGGDSGEYVILSAQYGTQQRHIDVTNRLKEVARQDRTFRMGNSTFGTDPDPGHVKTLRIYARGQDGRERMFEYREGSTVDGAQFRSWGGGDWGDSGWNGGWEGGYGGDSGEYVILSARYGTQQRNIDVTNRLKEAARRDRTFRMGNSTFGTDPDPGHVKTLRIYARGQDGRERMFEYREGSTVDGAQFRGWGGNDWGDSGWNGGWEGGYGGDSGEYVILSAQYGTQQRHIDVTSRLKELARTDRTFRMGNSTFGTDPDPGHVKTLRIYARGRDGRERMFEYREGSTVDGAQFRSWGEGDWGEGGWKGGWEGGYGSASGGDSGEYVILSAQYGTQQRHIDVTNRLKEVARQDRTFRMGNGTFGTDPDPGHVKTLRIYARGQDGRERMFEYREGSTVDGAQFRSWGSGDWGNEPWSGRWEGEEHER